MSASWPALVFAIFTLFWAAKIMSAVRRGHTAFGPIRRAGHRFPGAGFLMLLALYIFMLLISGMLAARWVIDPADFR